MLARDFEPKDRVAYLGTDVQATVVQVNKDSVDVLRDDGITDTLRSCLVSDGRRI